VIWPGGETQKVENVRLDTVTTIEQPR
jgi:hypothetical protein